MNPGPQRMPQRRDHVRLKVAITGAGGFIGRHVLAQLESEPVSIIAAVREPAKLKDVGGIVSLVEMDMSNPGADPYQRLQSPDVLIHLAWSGLPNYKLTDHFEMELPRQYAFLRTLIEAGLPSLLVTGTCFEYGMQTGAMSETTPALPNTPYGRAKDALRQRLEGLRKARPFAFTWARLFYAYGEDQPERALYQQLKMAVGRGDRSFNMSGGEQVRDYLHVDEVARLIVELALRHGDAGIVNVCSGRPVQVRELVNEWLQRNNWNMELRLGHYPYADYEPMSFWGERKKLNALLGATEVG